ncbi:hypothetical protein BCR33DRAFT_236040 [Rhizoclosmatium globosum]|uniref:Uncharacterized protein n=1 Tax=Rhizoclosmatium globosum TaxID=329046 RepID=A0A1Y2CAR8_9FUNG|nr:hypothetical protein BCR33DRAFT_236040 [Rhizoclosmatium globosum]|eukprot:ORY44133.1 hypothetical protein BCR33DRAFT_236040 [Rhizoclosmatium globosum]
MLSSKPSPTPKPAPKAAPAKSVPKPKPAAAVAAPLKPSTATAPPPRASTSAASSSSSSSSTSTSSIKQLHKSSRLATVASLQQKKQNLLTNTGLAIHSEDVGAVSVGELLEKSRRGSQWPGLGDVVVG